MNADIQIISAGAGSGKTYTLTTKLEALLASGEVDPAGVIATTFTRLAAGELQQRVRSALIESGQADVANRMEQALVGTVNGVCGAILARFAYAASLPPEQQVIDEPQGEILFYQALEEALAGDRSLVKRMNAMAQRLQIIDPRTRRQRWRQEVKRIVDAARANNQSAGDIRELGSDSVGELLAHFPQPGPEDLSDRLLAAVNHALAGIDLTSDKTATTRNYRSRLAGAQAALVKRRLSWPEWIALGKTLPGKTSRHLAEPIVEIAAQFPAHPHLQRDLRDYTQQVFAIAAASLETYQDLKARKGLVDFVDQEQRLYGLLDEPSVAETLGEELQLLMVDEFQDTSPIQLALFLKLSQLADRVIWVGDIKQSIYGFRGSDPGLMQAVIREVISRGSAPEILRQSWRSRPELVAYINALFVPAFAPDLSREEVALSPAHPALLQEPAVETWRLGGGRKSQRAAALAAGVRQLLASGRQVVDKTTREARSLRLGDIAILCRTNEALSELAGALAEAKIPVRYRRPGLLATPEGCLALACLRRLVDPLDTLACAEILSLTECISPEAWIEQRLEYLDDPDKPSHTWLEDVEPGPVARLKALRGRLPFLTPVEALRAALDAGDVEATLRRWGPTGQRARHRLNNLAALVRHAQEYLEQSSARSEPATTAGLLLWLYALHESDLDTQADGGGEDAIQLVTHHGAKGLEWPIVIATDLDAKLKPRLWGLTVLPASGTIRLETPLANRRLRYWPKFSGQQSAGVPLLDTIGAGPEGQLAMEREVAEARRLLYVSLTRARDGLILAVKGDQAGGEWMDTLEAPWMLPGGDTLQLPDGSLIPSALRTLEADDHEVSIPAYQPTALADPVAQTELLALRQSPSSLPPQPDASTGEIIELGQRIDLQGEFDPAALGSALHAAIAAVYAGHSDIARILGEHGVSDNVSEASAIACAERLRHALEQRYAPITWFIEYPLRYSNDRGQLVGGWIDLLLETEAGFVLVDHKSSPGGPQQWRELALAYSGQMQAYAHGISRITGKPVLAQWIHFTVGGALVELA